MVDLQFDLDKLFGTYAKIVSGQYKEALLELQNTNTKYNPPTLDIPNATVISAAIHIQECSAYYGTVSKLASYARSAQKLAEGSYKRKFRYELSQSNGTNAASREADADQNSSVEYEQMIFFESAVQLFNALEQSARSASDASRKISELINSHHMAELANKH